ncbi:MAG: family hydrolase [Solirubrobacterales bacterium]|jgi:HAD superfamily hydrolase (TIGR01509 family)|nr:family hydrolase [Solirubrobacterales bacterium]
MPPGVILDIDGTLVDTNYQHTLCWYEAFRQHGVHLPMWKLHRHMGMGGDQLVAALTDAAFEEEHGDDVRAAEKALYFASMPTVAPLEGARDLLDVLRRRGHKVVLASSAKAQEVDHYIDLLDARTRVDGWTTSADVEATKPEPDLVRAALDKLGGGDAVMVGDSTFDIEAAKRAGVQTIAVRTGGYSAAELEEAGAACVFDSIVALTAALDDTPLAAPD